MGAAGLFSESGASALRDELAVGSEAGADGKAGGFALVLGAVLEVGQRQGAAGVEAVPVLVNDFLGAGDGAALEVCIPFDLDVEAAVAGVEAALFIDAGVPSLPIFATATPHIVVIAGLPKIVLLPKSFCVIPVTS